MADAYTQANVEAVEERFRRAQERNRQIERARRIRRFVAFVGLLVFAACAYLGSKLSNRGIRDFSLANFSFKAVLGEESADSDSIPAARREYGANLRSILSRPVKLWAELPAELKPKKLAKGTELSVLGMNEQGEFSLYKATADGKGGFSVAQCSPFGSDSPLPWAQFKKQCRNIFLVEAGDAAYLSGSTNLAEAEKIKSQVVSTIGNP